MEQRAFREVMMPAWEKRKSEEDAEGEYEGQSKDHEDEE